MRSHCSLQTPKAKAPLQESCSRLVAGVRLVVALAILPSGLHPATTVHGYKVLDRGEWERAMRQMAGPPRVAFPSRKGTLDRPCCFILTFPGGPPGCRDNAGNKKRKRAKFQNSSRRGSWTEGGVC